MSNPHSPKSDPAASSFQDETIRLEMIADLSPNILFVVDFPDLDFLYVNQRVRELLGQEKDYFYREGAAVFKNLVHPDDYERRMENLEKCTQLTETEQSHVEVRLQVGKSGWQWFKITDKIFKREENGRVSQLIGTAQNIHEQKIAEERLIEEHGRLKNAQAIGHIGSFERKLPGDLLYCSEEYYRILGLEPKQEEINLEEFLSHVHPDDRGTYKTAIEHTHATLEPLDMVTRVIRPDGSLRYVHRRAVIQTENGIPIRAYGTIQDITERLEAEEERKKTDILLNATETVADTGSYELDLLTGRLYFSDGFVRLFGEEPGRVKPSPDWIYRRSHPEDAAGLRQILKLAAENKEAYSYTHRIYRKDGQMRVLEAHGTVITDAEENPIKFIGLVQDMTERLKAEEELRISEEDSRNLLNVLQNAPDPFLVLSPDLKIEIVSDSYLEATMTRREDIIGKYMFDVFPDNPDNKDATGVKNLRASFSKVLSSKQPHRMPIQHYDVPAPGGSFEEKYWNPVNTPVLDAAGEVEHLIHRVEDITEVTKSRAALEIAVEAARMGTWDLDLSRDFSGHRNFRHDQIFGYENPQEKWGWEIARKHIFPEDQPVFDAAFSEAMETGKLDLEVRVRWQDGSIHWMAINGRIYFDEQGKPLRAAGVNFEVTDRRQVEQALRESEQRFRNLVEASAVAVWETDSQGRVISDSPSWRAFTGQSVEEYNGNRWLDAVHPDDQILAASKWQEAVVSQENVDMEYRLQSNTGDYRWNNIKAIPILDTKGRITKWSGMNLDIHDKKEAEVAIIKAKEKAEAASRAKEDFVSTMSHEIRTPLNAVIGLTNLLLNKEPREDQKENLSSLSFSAKNLLSLINDILDFSKLEAGKMELAENNFDLPDLLKSLQQAHQHQARENDSSLELKLDKNIPARIATDQLKLSQVLHNLVSNAVKFTKKGQVEVSVELNRREDGLLWLNFSVEDTGIGIPPDKLEHIFDKFTQAESSTVRLYGGTGLGLSISKLLLDLMGSEIMVESSEGKGSRFYFSLPVKIAGREIPSEEPKKNQEKLEDLEHVRLLLVEDVEINRKIIVQFLENWWQLRPDEAVNGKEAIEMTKNKNYDLILMDVRMPEMDGYEATAHIRNLPGYESTPILALTADKNQEVEQTRQGQFSDLLTKPFEPRDLKRKVLHHLSVSGQGISKAAKESIPGGVPSKEETIRLMPSPAALQEYEQLFSEALTDRDEDKLNEICEKISALAERFQIEELRDNLIGAVVLLKENADPDRLEEISRRRKELFHQALEKMEVPAEPSFDISKFTAVARGNKEILDKLVKNSLDAFETYKEEFMAAGGDKEEEQLSDLVHKNTTSVHYIQAHHLAAAIEAYRNLLENDAADPKKLRDQKTLILREFDKVINGLRGL